MYYKCKITFFTSGDLKNHFEIVHEGQKEPLLTSASSKLKTHIYVHEARKHHKCEKCEKTFLRAINMKIHMKQVHERTNNHKCMVCEKFFNTSYHLKRHLLVHEGRKPLKCQKCEKTFKASYIKKHMKRVHDEGIRKNHTKCMVKCEICAIDLEKGNLKRHIQSIHERNFFKCTKNKCNKKFRRNSNLTRHLNTVHKLKKDSEITCTICSKSYSDKWELKKHQKNICKIQNLPLKNEVKKEIKLENDDEEVPETDSNYLNKNQNHMLCEKVSFASYHTKQQINNKDSLIQMGKKSRPCENLPMKNEIKKERLESDEEMPTFESDSNYLNKDIKAEIQLDLQLSFKTEDDVDLDEIPIFGIYC